MDIKKLISQMTMDEKIGQLAQYNANLFADSEAEITGPMADLGLTREQLKVVGSTLNFGTVQEMMDIQNKHLAEDKNKIPMLFMMDVIHGFRTIYPIPLALGCSFDPELVAEGTRMASKEATASGVQVTFTPMVDYVRDARWGRVMESCGEEPLLNGIMGAAQIQAFHGDSLKDTDSMATCVKHFAAYGGAEAGRDYNTVELSEHALREYYLPAYKACLDAGVDMTLSAEQMTKADKVTVSITVYNDSEITGKETVMLFIRDLVASTARPVCQLVAFKKIEVAPHERKTVEITLEEPMLRFWNCENEFVSEVGEFEIVTGYADHLVLKHTLNLK